LTGLWLGLLLSLGSGAEFSLGLCIYTPADFSLGK
jgi:hypothetical protein